MGLAWGLLLGPGRRAALPVGLRPLLWWGAPPGFGVSAESAVSGGGSRVVGGPRVPAPRAPGRPSPAVKRPPGGSPRCRPWQRKDKSRLPGAPLAAWVGLCPRRSVGRLSLASGSEPLRALVAPVGFRASACAPAHEDSTLAPSASGGLGERLARAPHALGGAGSRGRGRRVGREGPRSSFLPVSCPPSTQPAGCRVLFGESVV